MSKKTTKGNWPRQKNLAALHMPDVAALNEFDPPLSDQELKIVRLAIGLHGYARIVKLSFRLWSIIGEALLIGQRRAEQISGSSQGRGFNAAIAPFLHNTGLASINQGERWAARQCAAHAKSINAWLMTLPEDKRSGLNNPIDVWRAYNATKGGRLGRLPKSKQAPSKAVDKETVEIILEQQRDDLMEQVEFLELLLSEIRKVE